MMPNTITVSVAPQEWQRRQRQVIELRQCEPGARGQLPQRVHPRFPQHRAAAITLVA